MTDNGWTKWEKHVLFELDRLTGVVGTMNKDMVKIKVELAKRAGLWGVIGGIIPAVIAYLLNRS